MIAQVDYRRYLFYLLLKAINTPHRTFLYVIDPRIGSGMKLTAGEVTISFLSVNIHTLNL